MKKQRHHFANKGLYSQSFGFSNSHVQMWDLDHKGGWMLRTDAFKWWCWIRLLRIPWKARRSNQSILKKLNPKYSLEGLTLSWNSNILTTWCKQPTHWKRPWCWERLRVGGEVGNENEMLGWHHQLNGHKFEQALGDSEGQGRLACWSLWCHKEWDTT